MNLNAPGSQLSLQSYHPLATAIAHCLGRNRQPLLTVAGLIMALGSPVSTTAATLTVTNTNDSGPGSLRQALNTAKQNSEPDEIVFASDVSGTINLTTGSLYVSNHGNYEYPPQDTVIAGPGSDRLSIDGGAGYSVLGGEISQSKVTISGLTLRNAQNGISFYGQGQASLALEDIKVTDTRMHGVHITGSVNYWENVHLHNVDLSGNAGDGLASDPETLVTNSVITHNGGYGARLLGASIYDGDINFENSLIAHNALGGVSWYGCGAGIGVKNSVVRNNGGAGLIGDGVLIDGSTVSDNGGSGISASGAQIYNSTVASNQSIGVWLRADGCQTSSLATAYLDMSNSTLSGNAGGIYQSNGNTYIRNSTITGNVGDTVGGFSKRFTGDGTPYYLIYRTDDTIIENSIISGNQAPTNPDLDLILVYSQEYLDAAEPAEISHTIIGNFGNSLVSESVPGSNLFGVDPGLGPLQDNGGRVHSHALLPDSPAIDKGAQDFSDPLTFDSRGSGYLRVANGRIDMGAFELQTGGLPLGSVDITDGWRSLCHAELSPQHVVIAGPPTQHGKDPGVVRIRTNPQQDCPFQARFQEWDYRARDFDDRSHKTEQFSFIGLAPGVYNMPDGSLWEVGTFERYATDQWQRQWFQSEFPAPPALFLTMQSNKGPSAVSLHAKNVQKGLFKAAMFQEEYLKDPHSPEYPDNPDLYEKIGYLAIYHPNASDTNRVEGQASLGGTELPYTLERAWIDHNWQTVAGVPLRLEEEQSADAETAHRREQVSVLKLGDQVFVQQTTSIGKDTTAIRQR